MYISHVFHIFKKFYSLFLFGKILQILGKLVTSVTKGERDVIRRYSYYTISRRRNVSRVLPDVAIYMLYNVHMYVRRGGSVSSSIT